MARYGSAQQQLWLHSEKRLEAGLTAVCGATTCLTFRKMLLYLLCIAMFCFKIGGIKITSHDTSVRSGGKATLFSQLTETEDSLTRIIWWKKTREDPKEKSFFIIFPDGSTEHINGLRDRIQFIGNIAEKIGTVELIGMRLLDEGIYTCIFNLFPSGPFETNINVTVLVPPDVGVMGATPVSGDFSVTLASCFASNARPAAEVLWRLGSLQTSLMTRTSHTVHPNGTFTVVSHLLGAPFKHLNQQKIQCVVTHEALDKEIVLDYLINIHYPPKSVMIIPVSPTEAKEFQCVVDCNPSPTNYTWRREKETTPLSKGNKLLLRELSSVSNGLYICEASNQYGSLLGSLYVHVHTESSNVCWGLFGFIICCAVLCIMAYTLRLWKNKHSSQNEQQGTAAENQELEGRKEMPSDTSGETAGAENQENL